MSHERHESDHQSLGTETGVETGPTNAGDGNAAADTPPMLHGSGRTYDIHAAVFFGGRRRRVFGRLAAESGARPGHRVLDVGCGTGYFTRMMAQAVAPGGTAHGVDPSAEAISHARRTTRLDNCTFAAGVAEALDAPDGSYDIVVSSLMIHHLPGALRPRATSEMFRVLRPGGSSSSPNSAPGVTHRTPRDQGAHRAPHHGGEPGRPARAHDPGSGLRPVPQRRDPPVDLLHPGAKAGRWPLSSTFGADRATSPPCERVARPGGAEGCRLLEPVAARAATRR
jgi:SAM-dependent methyltransferase